MSQNGLESLLKPEVLISYYNGYNETNFKSISFLKSLFDKINSKGVEQSEDMLKTLEITYEEIQNNKILPSFIDKLLNDYNSSYILIERFVNTLGHLKMDDLLAERYYKNNLMIRDKMKDIIGLLNLYKEVMLARNEIKNGESESFKNV